MLPFSVEHLRATLARLQVLVVLAVVKQRLRMERDVVKIGAIGQAAYSLKSLINLATVALPPDEHSRLANWN